MLKHLALDRLPRSKADWSSLHTAQLDWTLFGRWAWNRTGLSGREVVAR